MTRQKRQEKTSQSETEDQVASQTLQFRTKWKGRKFLLVWSKDIKKLMAHWLGAEPLAMPREGFLPQVVTVPERKYRMVDSSIILSVVTFGKESKKKCHSSGDTAVKDLPKKKEWILTSGEAAANKDLIIKVYGGLGKNVSMFDSMAHKRFDCASTDASSFCTISKNDKKHNKLTNAQKLTSEENLLLLLAVRKEMRELPNGDKRNKVGTDSTDKKGIVFNWVNCENNNNLCNCPQEHHENQTKIDTNCARWNDSRGTCGCTNGGESRRGSHDDDRSGNGVLFAN